MLSETSLIITKVIHIEKRKLSAYGAFNQLLSLPVFQRNPSAFIFQLKHLQQQEADFMINLEVIFYEVN